MAGNPMAIVQNPTCDETCPEHCSQPWNKFLFKSGSAHNRSEKYLFGLPIPQFVSDDWTIDESLEITGGKL